MTTKKPIPREPQKIGALIQDVSISMTGQACAISDDAAMALRSAAEAAIANANAIKEIAISVRGVATSMGNGLDLNNVRADDADVARG